MSGPIFNFSQSPIAPSDLQKERLNLHFRALKEWNESALLVSRGSLERAWHVHYLDSIFISRLACKQSSSLPIFDVGTGAGFPGLILAIFFEQRRVILFEKNLKKRGFLEFVVKELGIENVEVEGALPEGQHEAIFLARAVKQPADLLKFFQTRMTRKSRLILNLGGDAEIPQLHRRFSVQETDRYELPDGYGWRRSIALSST